MDQLWKYLPPIEQFLFRIITSVRSDVKQEIFTVILDKIYSYISEPREYTILLFYYIFQLAIPVYNLA